MLHLTIVPRSQVLAVTDETNGLNYLLSGSTFFLALAAFYVGRSLWIARREWRDCAADTKVLYLLVAPPLTLAVDVLEVTDRLLWSRWNDKAKTMRRQPRAARTYRPKTPARASG